MKSKKTCLEILKIVNGIVFIAATIAVIVSRAFPYYECMIVALAIYIASFLVSAVIAIIEAIKIINKYNVSNTEEHEQKKDSKIIAILKALFWIAMFALAIMVLVRYIAKM